MNIINSQLLIEIKKKKQEVFMLKNNLEKFKKNMSNNKVIVREYF